MVETKEKYFVAGALYSQLCSYMNKFMEKPDGYEMFVRSYVKGNKIIIEFNPIFIGTMLPGSKTEIDLDAVTLNELKRIIKNVFDEMDFMLYDIAVGGQA